MADEPFKIVYVEKAREELKLLRAFDQKKIIDGIESHLRHEPTKVRRTRIKQMNQPFWSEYRLRIEDFRVYYNVDSQESTVTVLRVLEKGREPTEQETNHETN